MIPLLRSMDALSRSAIRALRLLGDEQASRVFTTVGPEQEYFLIDDVLLRAPRPDRTSGARCSMPSRPKGHELDDHYFGSIPERVLAFMMDSELEPAKLGVPVKTRHNEVAPAQYEIAPIFENSNVGSDHLRERMTWWQMQRVARSTASSACCTEKPFAGVNGSGKHNNWSMGTDTGHNLLEPGDTPADNLHFRSSLRRGDPGRGRHLQGLLRASVANIGQDHRLGANEAPRRDLLDLPRRRAGEGLPGDRLGRGRPAHAGRWRARAGHAGAAAAADARGRPQPHVAVRVHVQQVRVPRARVEHVARVPEHRAEHDRGRRRSTTWPTSSRPRSRAAPTSTRRSPRSSRRRTATTAGDLRRRQLHRRVARRGGVARAQEPAQQ